MPTVIYIRQLQSLTRSILLLKIKILTKKKFQKSSVYFNYFYLPKRLSTLFFCYKMLHLCFIILVFPSINISYIKYIKKSSLKNYTYSFFALCFHFLLLFFSLLSLLCGVVDVLVVVVFVVGFTSRLSRMFSCIHS